MLPHSHGDTSKQSVQATPTFDQSLSCNNSESEFLTTKIAGSKISQHTSVFAKFQKPEHKKSKFKLRGIK